MAILKHIASKNADYGEAQKYLLFQHDEYTGKPILDENGELIPRSEYFLDGLNCNPFTFDMECKELNALYHKNYKFEDVKSHHYIISFDPKDVKENGLTGERAQQIGLEYASKNFPGHQALVCTHTDGHNQSGNIHVHIVINSLRKFDTEHQDFMERSCDSRSGYKHHLGDTYLAHLKQSLMDICEREHLNQVNLLSPAEIKITDREYHARRRGQKKQDERNKEMLADRVSTRKTIYQTQKDYLRSSIEEAASISCSLEEFQKLLLEKYLITLKISRGRFSYLHPERSKPITGRNLGTHYEKDYLLQLLEDNQRHLSKKNKQNYSLPDRNISNNDHKSSTNENTHSEPFVFIKSDLRLVIDLQQCVKAQQDPAYPRRIKLINLQQMAETVAYIQEHGYDTRESLQSAFSEAQAQTTEIRKALRSSEQKIKEINEQIHYTGQYLANKSVYRQFIESNNKKKFRKEHQSEITLYKTARRILKENSGGGKLPSMKVLKAEKERLDTLKTSQYKAYQNLRKHQNELKTVCSNVDVILGKNVPQQEQLKSQDIS